jgi:hypothetical protein
VAQKVPKGPRARSRIAQVQFLTYVGKTPEEIFREGYNRAEAGFPVGTLVRFFDRRNIVTNAVLSHQRLQERYCQLSLSLKNARVSRAGKAQIQKLSRELKAVGPSVVNARKRIHTASITEFEAVVAARGFAALEEEYGKIRMLSRGETIDFLSVAKLSRHVHVEIFTPTYLLCRRENLTVYASTE